MASAEPAKQPREKPLVPTKEVRAELRAVAANLGLAATGSRDYHGTRKTGHDLGCNLTDVEVAEKLLKSNFDGG